MIGLLERAMDTAYLFPFSEALILTVLAMSLGLWWLRRTFPKTKGPTRFGGLVLVPIIILVLAQTLPLTPQLIGIFFAIVVIAVFGLWDDLRGLTAGAQLGWQLVVIIIVILSGVGILYATNPLGGLVYLDQVSFSFLGQTVFLFSALLTIVWLLLIVNSVNWLDGIDGLAGSVSLIAFLVIFFLSLKPEVSQPITAQMGIILAGAVLGFLFFNLPPARIHLGSVGSYSLGFFLGILAIISGGKIATAALVLGVPILDALWVILQRVLSGQSPLRGGDKKHLHYSLQRMGLTPGMIVLIYSLLAILFGGAALLVQSQGKLLLGFVVIAVVLVLVVYVATIQKRRGAKA